MTIETLKKPKKKDSPYQKQKACPVRDCKKFRRRKLSKLFNTIKSSNLLLDEAHKSLLYVPLIKRGGDDFQSLGLEINYETILNIGHSGVNVGNTSELFYFPDTDLLLVVLCNNRSGASNLYNFIKNNIPE